MTKSFTGNYPGKVDSKERIVLPSAFRRDIKDQNDVVFYIRKDIHVDCLVLYPEAVWDKIIADLNENTKFSAKKKQALLRGVAKDVFEVKFSGKNGRMLIRRSILDSVGISGKPCTFHGDNFLNSLHPAWIYGVHSLMGNIIP